MNKKIHKKSPQGADKLRNYFLDITLKDSFQKEVSWIRNDYNIPKKGFRKSEKHTQGDYAPKYPERWAHPTGEIDDGFWVEFFAILQKLCNKFKIPTNDIGIMYEYVLYNKIIIADEIFGLCMIQDFCDIGKIKYTDKRHNDSFPILIRISPYASQRDILNHIKAVYSKEIAPMQEKYKDSAIMLGKIRTKNEKVQKRNSFIIKNKKLSIKEIRTLLRVNGYEALDDGLIGKIISEYEKKRKQV